MASVRERWKTANWWDAFPPVVQSTFLYSCCIPFHPHRPGCPYARGCSSSYTTVALFAIEPEVWHGSGGLVGDSTRRFDQYRTNQRDDLGAEREWFRIQRFRPEHAGGSGSGPKRHSKCRACSDHKWMDGRQSNIREQRIELDTPTLGCRLGRGEDRKSGV